MQLKTTYVGALMFAMSVVSPLQIGFAQARVESNNVIVAQRCAANIKRLGEPTARRSQEGMMNLLGCDKTGPEILAKSWANPPKDFQTLGTLFRVSASMADRRLMKQLMIVAQDTTRAFNERVGALGTLGSFLNPSYRATVVNDPGAPGGKRVGFGALSHAEGAEGSERLTIADRNAIRSLCAFIRKHDPDSEVRALAQVVLGVN